MRVANSGLQGSLLMNWAETVLGKLTNLVDWPVRSLKLDELAQLYSQRETRDACNLSYKLGISRTTGLQTITIASAAPANGNTCSAPIIVKEGVSFAGPGGLSSVSSVDGVRTLLTRLPSGGSVTVSVGGAPMAWTAQSAMR